MMHILIPAAGASSRMRGRDKLLETIDGVPLLARQVQAALATGAPVLVTLPLDDTARRKVLAGMETTLRAIDAGEGIAASLRAGAGWALERKARGLMILLADMPDITSDDIRRTAQDFDGSSVLRGTDIRGRPGHPVILPARLLPAMQALQGDTGAKDMLKSETIKTIPLPGYHATTDLDTPEAWADWRRHGTDSRRR